MARALHWFRNLSGIGVPEQAHSLRAADSSRQHPRIRVLAVGMSAEETNTLKAVAVAESWNEEFADSLETAIDVLADREVPLILLDRDGCGVDWRTALEGLALAAHGSCILLISRVNDEYLWQEVVQRRGFDVISKPFSKDQLLHDVNRAWLFWKSDRADRFEKGRGRG